MGVFYSKPKETDNKLDKLMNNVKEFTDEIKKIRSGPNQEPKKNENYKKLIKYNKLKYDKNIPIIFKCKVHDIENNIIKINSEYENNIKDIICEVNEFLQCDSVVIYSHYVYFIYNNLSNTRDKDLHYIISYISSVFTQIMNKYYSGFIITTSSFKLNSNTNEDGLKNYIKKIAIYNDWNSIVKLLYKCGKINKTFIKHNFDKSVNSFWYKGHTISKLRMHEKYLENTKNILKPEVYFNQLEKKYNKIEINPHISDEEFNISDDQSQILDKDFNIDNKEETSDKKNTENNLYNESEEQLVKDEEIINNFQLIDNYSG